MSLDDIIATGTYGGTGALLSVALGWQPAFVIISARRTTGGAGSRCLAFKTDTMLAANYVQCTTAAAFVTTPGITLTTTGFNVGAATPINAAGFTYDYVALRAGEWLDTGSFSGTAPVTMNVALGRQPSFVFQSHGAGTIEQFVKADQEGGEECTGFAAAVQRYPVAGGVGITIGANGFSAQGAGPNTSGEIQHWCALHAFVGGNAHFESGTYSGTGVSQTITLGRQPRWLFIVARTPTPAGWAFKTDQMPANAEGRLVAQYDWATTVGATITATGFTTGTNNSVLGKSYYWLAGFF